MSERKNEVNAMARELAVQMFATATGLGSMSKEDRKELLASAIELCFECAEVFFDVEENRG